MLKLGESLCNVAKHGHQDGARCEVPIESETEVAVAGPFEGDGVEGLESGGKLLDVLVAGVLDSEVITKQTEEDRTGSMGEDTGSVFCGCVTEFGEILLGLDRHSSAVARCAELNLATVVGRRRRWRGLPLRCW
jgi:hypothetical protein